MYDDMQCFSFTIIGFPWNVTGVIYGTHLGHPIFVLYLIKSVL